MTLTLTGHKRLNAIDAALGDDYRQIVGYAGKIRYFLDHNYRVGVSLGDLADFLSLSVSRTSRLVKSRTGMTFPAALAERRIERARFLLKNSAFNMEAIAEQCGFSDVAYFFKVFKQRQKISPAAYRRQNDSSLVANGP